MRRTTTVKAIIAILSITACSAATVLFDIAASSGASILVDASPDSARVRWQDGAGRPCIAQFSLDPARPLITLVAVNGKNVILFRDLLR